MHSVVKKQLNFSGFLRGVFTYIHILELQHLSLQQLYLRQEFQLCSPLFHPQELYLRKRDARECRGCAMNMILQQLKSTLYSRTLI